MRPQEQVRDESTHLQEHAEAMGELVEEVELDVRRQLPTSTCPQLSCDLAVLKHVDMASTDDALLYNPEALAHNARSMQYIRSSALLWPSLCYQARSSPHSLRISIGSRSRGHGVDELVRLRLLPRLLARRRRHRSGTEGREGTV